MNSVNQAILGIQQKDVNNVAAKVSDLKIMNVTEKVGNVNANKITTAINVKSVRCVVLSINFLSKPMDFLNVFICFYLFLCSSDTQIFLLAVCRVTVISVVRLSTFVILTLGNVRVKWA